jgi:prevent-host-death family protein
MKIAPLAQVKDHFSAYIQECQESPVVVTKNGKPVALLTAIKDDDDLDSLLLANNRRFLALLEKGYRSVKETGGIPSKEFWARVKRRRTRKKIA